jgi:hypothetical protein
VSLITAVIDVHDALVRSAHAHAFGGALALAHYAEPRATVDIDVNVFVPGEDVAGVLASLAPLGYTPERDRADWVPIAGIRLRRRADLFPVDLFPSLDPAYDEIAARVQHFGFGPDRVALPFLSAEDLVLFKLSFGRDKDWVDVRQLCRSGVTLDVDYIERQLIAVRGPHMYPRLARLRSLVV